jgi:CO/xanthine dehydrogenase Mo-binding subunit
VRSPRAHARIRSVDLSLARAAPGVVDALNGSDLLQLLPPVPEGQISLPAKWTSVIQHKFLNPQEPLLAHDKARHVGEALAIIVAETRNQAEDAAELVSLDRRIYRRPGRCRGGNGPRAAPPQAPLLSSPLRRGADGMPRRAFRL